MIFIQFYIYLLISLKASYAGKSQDMTSLYLIHDIEGHIAMPVYSIILTREDHMNYFNEWWTRILYSLIQNDGFHMTKAMIYLAVKKRLRIGYNRYLQPFIDHKKYYFLAMFVIQVNLRAEVTRRYFPDSQEWRLFGDPYKNRQKIEEMHKQKQDAIREQRHLSRKNEL